MDSLADSAPYFLTPSEVAAAWARYGNGRGLRLGIAEWLADVLTEAQGTDIIAVGAIVHFKALTGIDPCAGPKYTKLEE